MDKQKGWKDREEKEELGRGRSGLVPYPLPIRMGDLFYHKAPEKIIENGFIGWRLDVPGPNGETVTKVFWERRQPAVAESLTSRSVIDGRKKERGLPHGVFVEESVTARDHLARRKEDARGRRLFQYDPLAP